MDSIFKERHRECDSMLNREGVSVVERTRRLVYCKNFIDIVCRVPERVMSEVKQYVRRYSV
jgi:spermidine synthase